MYLRRLEVNNFRKIRHLVVDDLQDGLNVISGDNEAGKSTILAALRAALFERHRLGGEAAAAMLPYNQSVRPEIHVDFDLNGNPWSLRKAFCQKAEVELTGPGERHTGDPAEERLAELFGFTPPNRGASKPQDHQGIYGLLWVEQGASHRALGVGAGRESLASALEREVGQVIGGERGRALLAAAEARRNTFWDKHSTPKPRGDFKALQEEVENLRSRRKEVETLLASHDEKVALLSRKREIITRYDRDSSLEKAVAAVAAAKQVLAQTKELEDLVVEAGKECRRLAAERQAAADRLEARENLIRQVEAARDALNQVTIEVDRAKTALSRIESVDAAGSNQLEQARTSRIKADQAVATLRQALDHQRAELALTRLEQQLAAVEEADTKRRRALAIVDAISLDQKQLASLEKAQDHCTQALAHIEAASVRIVFQPTGKRTIKLDDGAVDPGRALLLSKDAVIELEGFGRLEIHPGGGVDDLVLAHRDAEHSLQRALQQVGVTSVQEARSELQRKVDALADAGLQKKLIAASATDGVDALRQDVENQRAIVKKLSTHDCLPADATEENLDLARQQQQRAAKLEAAAIETSAQNRSERERINVDVAVKAERAAAGARDLENKIGDLNATRAKSSDIEFNAAFQVAEKTLQAAIDDEKAATLALEQANPEAANLSLRRAENVERQMRGDIERTTGEIRDLQVELKTLGRDGLGEQLAEVAGELALKERQALSRKAEADGARLLYETLAQAQRESKDRWLGPVRERVAPYLRLIHQDSDIVLNEETLEIEQFVRDGVQEPFEGLSVGAREQAAVITRLALADILRSSGLPSIVILDDALVNTDEQRLDRMHLVLNKAASTLQILILTCRERDFIQLGAPIRRI